MTPLPRRTGLLGIKGPYSRSHDRRTVETCQLSKIKIVVVFLELLKFVLYQGWKFSILNITLQQIFTTIQGQSFHQQMGFAEVLSRLHFFFLLYQKPFHFSPSPSILLSSQPFFPRHDTRFHTHFTTTLELTHKELFVSKIQMLLTLN